MRIRGAVLEQIGLPRPYAESRPLSVGELDLAEPGDTELLVRIEAAGLCHSDLSVVDGNRVRPVPMLLGHEAAAVVERAGAAVQDMPAGQRIVMTFLPRCGQCPACATNGLTPCEPGSAANAAGTLMGGCRATADPSTTTWGFPASPRTPSSTAAPWCRCPPTCHRWSRRCSDARFLPVAGPSSTPDGRSPAKRSPSLGSAASAWRR